MVITQMKKNIKFRSFKLRRYYLRLLYSVLITHPLSRISDFRSFSGVPVLRDALTRLWSLYYLREACISRHLTLTVKTSI